MKRRVVKKNGRKEAFLGAIIGTVAGIAGSIISGKKQKKADELAFKQAQAEQNRIDGLQQAQALSSSYANQSYVDQYKDKVVLKNGGKMKVKAVKKGDRIDTFKKYKVGGRIPIGSNKKEYGSLIGKDGIGGVVSGGIGGVGSLISSIFSKPKAPKTIVKSDGFSVAAPKTGIAPTSYTLDADGNPLTTVPTIPASIEPQLDGLTGQRMKLPQAKVGKRLILK